MISYSFFLIPFQKLLIEISENGLNKRNILSSNKEYNETYYLLNIKKNIEDGMSPADYLLKKYKGVWKNSLDQIYKDLIF